MKPRHSAEQSTVAVNKSVGLGKTGFASAFNKLNENSKSQITNHKQILMTEISNPKNDEKITEKIIDGKIYKVHGPSDPQEQYSCDSCQ